MAERLSDVDARIGSVRQLSAVITVMRGIAATCSREASVRLDGACAYAATIGAAIAKTLALLPGDALPRAVDAPKSHLIFELSFDPGLVPLSVTFRMSNMIIGP